MFFASVSLSPEIRASNGADAVFTSAPTALTQSSTTASSLRASCTWLTSCWYCPTPIALGSMRTSSASGSWSRRAIDTAPRSDTSRSGNSFAASSEAEYTEAPASETMTFVSARSGCRDISSAASLSVSRDAVPLPMEISCTPCLRHSVASVLIDPSQSFRGSCG